MQRGRCIFRKIPREWVIAMVDSKGCGGQIPCPLPPPPHHLDFGFPYRLPRKNEKLTCDEVLNSSYQWLTIPWSYNIGFRLQIKVEQSQGECTCVSVLLSFKTVAIIKTVAIMKVVSCAFWRPISKFKLNKNIWIRLQNSHLNSTCLKWPPPPTV